MNRMAQLVTLTTALVAFSAESRDREPRREKHALPIREIDQPLTQPQRAASLKVQMDSYAFYAYAKKDGVGSGDRIVSKPQWDILMAALFPHFKYGITDSLEISTGQFFFPTLTYQFHKNTTLENGVLKISGPSFAAFAGLEYFGLDHEYGGRLNFYGNFGVKGKLPIRQNVWLAPELVMRAGNSEDITITASMTSGFQATDRWSLKPATGCYVTLIHNDSVGVHPVPFVGLGTTLQVSQWFGLSAKATGAFYGIGRDYGMLEGKSELACRFNW